MFFLKTVANVLWQSLSPQLKFKVLKRLIVLFVNITSIIVAGLFFL